MTIEPSTIRDVLGKISEAGLLWNREAERFGTLMGEATALLINSESQADAYLRNLERLNTKLTDEGIALKAEVARLEKCLEDGDYYPCEECLGVWSCDDLTDVNGDNFCPRCVDEARRVDAEEAAQEQEDQRVERELYTNNMRAAG